MKIKVKLLGESIYCTLPKIIEKGDWIDLSLAKDVVLSAPQSGVLREKKNEHGVITRVRNVELPVTLLPLGVAMELPKGFEAVIVVRSSTPKKWGIMQANAYAVIDNSYCGDNDEWRLPVITLRSTEINAGTRIAQFRIQLSQKATMWQKIKWLFSNKIEICQVTSLNNKDRKGIGSTGD